MMPPSTIINITMRGTQRHQAQFWGARYASRKARSAAISTKCRTQYVDSCSQLMYERALEMARLKVLHLYGYQTNINTSASIFLATPTVTCFTLFKQGTCDFSVLAKTVNSTTFCTHN